MKNVPVSFLLFFFFDGFIQRVYVVCGVWFEIKLKAYIFHHGSPVQTSTFLSTLLCH